MDKGAGLENSAALVFEVDADVKPGGIRWAETSKEARFPVEPGMGYKFEGWLKTDELRILRGRELGLYFAAFDKNGKEIKGAAAIPVADNAVGFDGWICVRGEVPALPAEAVNGALYFYSGPCVGRAIADNLSVRPVALNPVDRLVVSSYRAEAWKGDVSFAAAYNVNPLKDELSDLVSTLEYQSPTGRAEAACSLADGVAKVTLPVEAFAFGKNEVKLVLSRKDGRELGRSSCFFRREAGPMPRQVTFDERHRTLIEGKPFFPLGMYWHWKEVTRENLEKYTKDGPFNCLVAYGSADEAKMDLCQSFGIKVIASLSGFFKEIAKAGTPQKAEEIFACHPRAALRRFRRHPAVMAWYLADEIQSIYEETLAAKRDIVYELDPDHPTWICHDKPEQLRELIRGYDVIGIDPYPIGNHGGPGRTSIGAVAAGCRKALKQTYGFRPLWVVPQAFDWGYWRPSETNRVEVRMPTKAEFRSMTWQAIAAGANGLVYYSFYDLLLHDDWPKERTAGAWENLCEVAREVKSFEPVLLSNGTVPKVEGCPAEVVARAWSHDGNVHLVLVNTLREKVSGSLTADGQKISYELDPIEVKFIQTRRFK